MATDGESKTVAYEDGEAVVICDRTNPNAWIRSDTVLPVEETERERVASK